jgi:hypothetical protein
MDPALLRIIAEKPTTLGSPARDSLVGPILVRAGNKGVNANARTRNTASLRRLHKEMDKASRGARSDLPKTRADWILRLVNHIDGSQTNKEKAEGKAEKPKADVKWANLAHGVQPKKGEISVKEKKTLEDGNCFYSGIYRSARELGILGTFLLLGLETDTEMEFIRSFRELIANEIIADHLPKTAVQNGELDTYNSLVQADLDYKQIIAGFPAWFQKAFPQGEIGTRDHFLNVMAAHVRKNGEWVGEIEVRIATALLLKHNIQIVVHKNKESNLKKTVGILNLIHLYNPRDQHYTYFSFPDANGEPGSRQASPPSREKGADPTVVHSPEKEKCPVLHDPCTGKPIADFKELERRVQQLKEGSISAKDRRRTRRRNK